MMRSLWTAASGMISQQSNIDTITNNLANVNTYGYKKERLEFKSLLYQTMQRANLDPANQTGRPVNLQVGHGVRSIAVSRNFTTGNFQTTSSMTDFAIEGDGFFAIQRDADSVCYTKDGSFKLSRVDDGLMLSTSEGYPVLSTDGDVIIIPANVMASDVAVDEEGNISYVGTDGIPVELGAQIRLVQFPNPQGLEAIGSNLFTITSSTGDPMNEVDGEVNRRSRILQGVLEMSNVQIASEMVDMIVAQRAYEVNSKAITTTDDMLQTANNLKRG